MKKAVLILSLFSLILISLSFVNAEYTILNNTYTKKSCFQLCAEIQGNCVSIGTDSSATNGKRLESWCYGYTTEEGDCYDVMDDSCYQYKDSTNCRCYLTPTYNQSTVLQLCRRYADNNKRASAPWQCVNLGVELLTDFVGDVNSDDDFDLKINSTNQDFQNSCQLCRRYADNNGRASAPWECVYFNTELLTDFVGDVDSNDDFDLEINCINPTLQKNCRICRRYADNNERASAPWVCVPFDNTPLLTDFVGDVDSNDDFDLKIECDCVPDCSGKNCGDDGCGGSCGSCPSGQTCSDGVCTITPQKCSSPSQTIMRISDTTNAHGEVWNGTGNYPIEICYDTIFGKNYNGTNPHSCTGTNKVVGLSTETNAHAEIPSLNNYNTNVCYGDLQCQATTQSCSVFGNGTDYKEVVRLSTETNAHLETTSGTGNYPIKICCKSVATPSIPPAAGEAYWANMNNVKISTADVNDTVKLIWNTNLSDGTKVNFTIKELGSIDCTGNWPDSDKYLSSTVINGKAIAVWKVRLCSGIGSDIPDGYNFTVTSNGFQSISNTLNVSVPENNAAPSTSIIKPTSYQKFMVGENISFEQISSDEDDDLNAVWDFDDGTKTTLNNCLTTGNCNTTHIYNTQGTKTITLTVNEATRNPSQSAEAKRVILIYKEGINVFSLIKTPDPEQEFPSNTKNIFFDASTSYVANCSTTCPSGKSCYNVSTLQCYDLEKSHPLPNYNLWFNWTFIGPSMTFQKSGSWNNNYNSVVEFNHTFIESGKITVKLKVGYEPL